MTARPLLAKRVVKRIDPKRGVIVAGEVTEETERRVRYRTREGVELVGRKGWDCWTEDEGAP